VHILLVDDEPDITFVLKRGLTLAGFSVDTFNDPVLALDKFKASVYELLVFDVKMPQMDGFTLYEKIRQIDDKAKVCFMTAFDVEYDKIFRSKFPHLSAKCFMRKPISIKEMVRIARSELNLD
jgi:DNA-binding response OmpR family regulator